MKRILILAPHTDDGEYGCGASISRYIEEGSDIYYAAFTLAEDSVPFQFPKDVLETEVKSAMKVLGIKPDNLILYNYRVRYFEKYRQEILEDMLLLDKNINPDIVFMPSLNDIHQDHHVIAMEGLRAFKKTTILGYEIPWNNMNFATQCFITLEERHLKKKINALNCYYSQKDRYYASDDFIRSLLRTRGTQIGCQYAEVFEVIRWIM